MHKGLVSVLVEGHLPRSLHLGLALLAGLALLSSGWVLDLWHPISIVTGEMLSVLTAGVAAACCVAASVMSRGTMRVSWSLFALLMAMYGAGDALWLAFGGGDEGAPILGVADALYMGALLPVMLGLLTYPVLQGIRGRWRPLLLDASVLCAALLFASHALVLHTVFARASGPLERFMLTVYPVTDLLLAGLVLLLMLRSIGQPRLDVVLIGVTFTVYTVADNGYALSTLDGRDIAGTWVDVCFTVAPLLLAAAALIAGTTPTPRRTLKRHLSGVLAPLLPDLAALAALALALASGVGGTVSAVLGIVTLTAVGVRQIAQTSSAQALRSELRRRIAERTRELAQMTEHNHQLDAMKYEFVTAVSHELRTPLSAIRGALEMLHDGDGGALPDRAVSLVGTASRGSERLSRLVNDIIDLERLESGGFGFSPSTHEVVDLLEAATQALMPLAHEHGVDIVVTGAEGRVWCDADRIEQVLINLIGNALKFSASGASVTVSAEQCDKEFLLSVRDEARGIPASELEAVFDRFHQVENNDSLHLGGAGLGLTISQRIIDRHAGRIWVESPHHGGATFRFTLPRYALAAPDLHH